MGNFYVDESICDEAGFIISACVYTDIDLTEDVNKIIKTGGFDPNVFEYKSNPKDLKEPRLKNLIELKELLTRNCKLGLTIIPNNERKKLGKEIVSSLKQFISLNSEIEFPLKIYFDEGIHISNNSATELEILNCEVYTNQNSKYIKGIQLADLAAHSSSTWFKGSIGLMNKKVLVEEIYPDVKIEIDFEMQTNLRYCLFHEPSKEYKGRDTIEDFTFNVEPYGLYISPFCNKELQENARRTFSQVYLGCIH